MSDNNDKQCCGNCVFWLELGYCRRYPQTENGKKSEDWCGEWAGISGSTDLDKPSRGRPAGKWWSWRIGK